MSFQIFNQPTKKSLALNISLFLLIQIIISCLVFGLGWDKGHNPAFVKKSYVVPSGALVGIVWLILYILMSIARWYLNRFNGESYSKIKYSTTALLVWCSLYPFYTFAIDSAYGYSWKCRNIFFVFYYKLIAGRKQELCPI
jgi:tryptophan-rich sensory protein